MSRLVSRDVIKPQGVLSRENGKKIERGPNTDFVILVKIICGAHCMATIGWGGDGNDLQFIKKGCLIFRILCHLYMPAEFVFQVAYFRLRNLNVAM